MHFRPGIQAEYSLHSKDHFVFHADSLEPASSFALLKLRELNNDTFSLDKGNHILNSEISIRDLPRSNKMVVLQIKIHGRNEQVAAVQIEKVGNKVKMFLFNHSYRINRTIDDDYLLGSKFKLFLKVNL